MRKLTELVGVTLSWAAWRGARAGLRLPRAAPEPACGGRGGAGPGRIKGLPDSAWATPWPGVTRALGRTVGGV